MFKYLKVLLTILFICFSGCSRNNSEQNNDVSEEIPVKQAGQKKNIEKISGDLTVEKHIEHVQPEKKVIAPISKKQKKKILSSADVPIRLVAFFNGGTKHTKVGLVNIKTDYSRIVAVGASFENYIIMSIDDKKESVVLENDSSRVELFMGASSQLNQAGSIAAVKTKVEIPVDIRSAKAKIYEQTEDERVANIDPNDYKTWPEHYRGPAIERALQKNKLNPKPNIPQIEADINKLPANFTPTEDEINRGIDPNDSGTWPENYRGPAIERAMQGNK